MKNRKAIALLTSLTLMVGIALPGTLALAADQDVESSITEETAAPAPVVTDTTAESEQPAEPIEPTETTKPAESEQPAETAVPSPVASEKPAEKEAETVSETPDASSLYTQIMACTTLDAIWAMIDASSEDALNALTDAQWTLIDARIEALEPEPAPAIVIEESEPPVESEVGYETVAYTYVAPLGEPITGQHR